MPGKQNRAAKCFGNDIEHVNTKQQLNTDFA